MPGRRDRALGALLLLLATGCGSGSPSAAVGGPLDVGQDVTEYCFEVESDDAATIEVAPLRNVGSAPVELEQVVVEGAEGLDVLDAVVVPVTSENSIGNGAGYPPPPEDLRSFGVEEDWRTRVPAGDAVLAPRTDEDVLHVLVVGVRRQDAGAARFSSVRVDYSVDGDGRSVDIPTSLELRDVC